MPTFEDLARRAQGLTQLTVPMPQAVQWASDRVHELLGKRRLAILRRHLELFIPGATTTGTVTVTRNSRIITGNAAAQTAWATLPEQFPQGWFIRVAAAWYKIDSKTTTTLTLSSPFAEDDRTASSYTLLQRYHPLSSTTYKLEEHSFLLARLNYPLTFINPTTLIQSRPSYWSFGGLPQFVTEAEPGLGDVKQLEVFPSPAESELITYDAYILKDDFTYADPLPLGLEIHHILPGLLADFYTWAASSPEITEQALSIILNEKARSLTRWEGAKDAALMRLSAHQMQQFVLVGPQSRQSSDYHHDITNAHDEVWSRP